MDCPLSHMVKIEGCGCTFCKEVSQLIQLPVVGISVGDPDPHVFEPPGSGSVSQMYESGSFLFVVIVLNGLK